VGNSTKDKETKKKPSFFKGLKKEFKKISWPNKNDTTKQTASVVVVSVILGLIIAFLDTIIQYGVDYITTLTTL